MLKSLQQFFDSILPTPSAESAQHERYMLQLATAVLLVEVMRADFEMGEVQRTAVVAGLRERFALSEDELDQLLASAEQAANNATDYFAFTSRINDGFGMEQKLRMIEHMWRVAYADGTLSANENHLMHKVSELLYIPHGAYVNAKMRAQQAAASGT